MGRVQYNYMSVGRELHSGTLLTDPFCKWFPGFVWYSDTHFTMIPLMAVGTLNHWLLVKSWHSACAIDWYCSFSSNAGSVASAIGNWKHCKMAGFEAPY